MEGDVMMANHQVSSMCELVKHIRGAEGSRDHLLGVLARQMDDLKTLMERVSAP